MPPVAALLAAFALALPWLNPIAHGPSASVQPWLFSAACAVALAVLLHGARTPRAVAWGCAALGAWALLRSGATLDTLALAGALLLVVLAARAARAAVARDAVGLFASAWLAAAVVSTVLALAQYFGVAHVFGPFASASEAGEAYANLRQRNQFATLTAIGVAAALWHAARAERLRWRDALAVSLLAFGDAATTSRTGLLELAVLGALALVWTRRLNSPAARLALVAGAAYLVASWALPALHEALLGTPGASIWTRVPGGEGCSSRTVLWSNVLHLVAQKPWLGWGWGELDYAHYATLYGGDRFCDILDNAHNLPLHLAVELGLPAALIALAVLAGVALRARPWAERDASRQLAWSVLALIALHSLLEYPLWYGPFQVAAGAAAGLLARRDDARPAAARGELLLPLALGIAVVYAAWDYRRVSQIYVAPDQRLAAYQDDTLEKVKRSWLFHQQALFADLTLTTVDRSNAARAWEQSQSLLHYSPEPKVIERAIESATFLGRDADALWHLARFRAAFPQAHAEWASRFRAAQSNSKVSMPLAQPSTTSGG